MSKKITAMSTPHKMPAYTPRAIHSDPITIESSRLKKLAAPSIKTQVTDKINHFFIQAFTHHLATPYFPQKDREKAFQAAKLLPLSATNQKHLTTFCSKGLVLAINSTSQDYKTALLHVSQDLFSSLDALYRNSLKQPSNNTAEKQAELTRTVEELWIETNTALQQLYRQLEKELKGSIRFKEKHVYVPFTQEETVAPSVSNLLDRQEIKKYKHEFETDTATSHNQKRTNEWKKIRALLKESFAHQSPTVLSEPNELIHRLFLAAYLQKVDTTILEGLLNTDPKKTKPLDPSSQSKIDRCKDIIIKLRYLLIDGTDYNDHNITQLAILLLGNSDFDNKRLPATKNWIKSYIETKECKKRGNPNIQQTPSHAGSLYTSKTPYTMTPLTAPSLSQSSPIFRSHLVHENGMQLNFEDDAGSSSSEFSDVDMTLLDAFKPAGKQDIRTQDQHDDILEESEEETQDLDPSTTPQSTSPQVSLHESDSDDPSVGYASKHSKLKLIELLNIHSSNRSRNTPPASQAKRFDSYYDGSNQSRPVSPVTQASRLDPDEEEDDTSIHSVGSFKPHTSDMHPDASNNMDILVIYEEEQSGTNFERTTSPQKTSERSSKDTTSATPQPQQTQSRRISMQVGFIGVNTGRKARADQQLARLNLLNYATDEELRTIVPDKEADTVRAELVQELNSINSCTNIAHKYKLINAASTKYTISDALADTLRGRETTVSPAVSSSITPEQVEGPASNDTVKATLSTKYTCGKPEDPLSDKELGDLNWIIDCMEAFVARKENEILNPPKKEKPTRKSFFGQLFSQKEKSEPHTPTLASIKSNPTINGQSHERHLLEKLKGKSNTKDKLATAILLANRYGIQLYNPEETQNMGRTPTSDPIGEDSDTEYGRDIEAFLDVDDIQPGSISFPSTSASKVFPQVTDSDDDDEKPIDTGEYGSELGLGSQGQKFAFAAAKEQQEEVSVTTTTRPKKGLKRSKSEENLGSRRPLARTGSLQNIPAATLPEHFMKAYNDLQRKADTHKDKDIAEHIKRTLSLVNKSTDIEAKIKLIRSAAKLTGVAIEEPTPGDRKTATRALIQPSPAQTSSATATAKKLPPSDEQTLSPAAQNTLKQLVSFSVNTDANKLLQAIGDLDNVQARETLLGSEQCKDLLARLESKNPSDTPNAKAVGRRGSAVDGTESGRKDEKEFQDKFSPVLEQLTSIPKFKTAQEPSKDTATSEGAKEVASTPVSTRLTPLEPNISQSWDAEVSFTESTVLTDVPKQPLSQFLSPSSEKRTTSLPHSASSFRSTSSKKSVVEELTISSHAQQLLEAIQEQLKDIPDSDTMSELSITETVQSQRTTKSRYSLKSILTPSSRKPEKKETEAEKVETDPQEKLRDYKKEINNLHKLKNYIDKQQTIKRIAQKLNIHIEEPTPTGILFGKKVQETPEEITAELRKLGLQESATGELSPIIDPSKQTVSAAQAKNDGKRSLLDEFSEPEK